MPIKLKNITGLMIQEKDDQYFMNNVITHADEELADIQSRSMQIGHTMALSQQSEKQIGLNKENLARIIRNSVPGNVLLSGLSSYDLADCIISAEHTLLEVKE